MKTRWLLGASLLLVACGGAGEDAKSAADADQGAALQGGTSVCISDLAGVRYALEDALERQDLSPADSCMGAQVQLSEHGKAKSWVMKYRRVGDPKWTECKSSEDSRRAFASECIGAMKGDLGGG